METGLDTLTYAVRPRIVLKYLGQLAIMLAILTLAPLLVSLAFGEYAFSARYLSVIAILLLFALPTARLPVQAQVQTNEALCITALAFTLAPLLSTIPFMGAGLSFIDALFEAISAITTTGLTTLATLQDQSQTFLFARAWMQWYGGLGIVVLSVALLMGHHMAARRLTEPVTPENLVTTARTYALRTLKVYLALTTLALSLVWPMTGDGFIALTHVLSTLSTGGFSPLNDSLAGLDGWTVRYTLMLFALCGAIPFMLFYAIAQGNWRAALADGELRALLLAILLVSALLLSFGYGAGRIASAEDAHHALLLAISAQSGTGFTTYDLRELDAASKLALIASMGIGGGMGSTAGGFKILRLLILLRLIQLVIRRTAMPSHAVAELHLHGRPVGHAELTRALLLILLFGCVMLLSWAVFLAWGYAPLDALFEVVSATATVGLSVGITGAELPAALKLVLCLDMLLGRVEIIALLVLLYPRTWMGRRTRSV